MVEHELTVITGSSVIMSWMKNENLLNWEPYFERNLFMNIKGRLKNISVYHMVQSRNPWADNWKIIAENHIQSVS